MEEEKKDNLQNDDEINDEIIEGEVVDEGQQTGEQSAMAAVSEEEYNQLAKDLDKALSQSKEYFEGWQRERADFANYKRRVERDQVMVSANIKGEFVKRYLPVLDDLERALKTRPTDGAAATWSNGIELVARKLQTLLENEGVKRIPAETEEFNPTRHEAISYEESPDHSGGQIIEVIQQGYTLGDRVLRPALVRVAR